MLVPPKVSVKYCTLVAWQTCTVYQISSLHPVVATLIYCCWILYYLFDCLMKLRHYLVMEDSPQSYYFPEVLNSFLLAALMFHHRWLDCLGAQKVFVLQTCAIHGTCVDLKTFNLHYQMVRTLLRLRRAHLKARLHLNSAKIWEEFRPYLNYILFPKCLTAVPGWLQTNYVADWTLHLPLGRVYALMETLS